MNQVKHTFWALLVVVACVACGEPAASPANTVENAGEDTISTLNEPMMPVDSIRTKNDSTGKNMKIP